MKILIIFGILWMDNLRLSECLDCSVKPKNTEIRLKQKLLCSYDKDSRPEGEGKNGTAIKVAIFLKSFDYNEYSGTIELHSWLGLRWTDIQLKWDPAEYDGIESLTIFSDEIWMPDLALYNARYTSDETNINLRNSPIETTQFEEACSSSHCIIFNKGIISCMPPCTHSGHCRGIYTNWPFDIQNCTLHFGSWMHTGSEISYKADGLQVDSDALAHTEWKIVSIGYRNFRGNYSCCPNETYPSIRVNVIVERHASSYRASIVAPMLVLCVINLATLWIDPLCMERIILCVVSLMSHFTYQQQLSWLVPKNGDTVPTALTFSRDSIIISTILLLQTVLLRGLLHCKSETPNWIKTTTDSLRSNKIGQLMFTNPYLINRENPLNNDAGENSNLVEEQPVEDNIPKTLETTTKSNVWITAVRIIDSLMFIALVICYIILFIGWLPNSGAPTPQADGKKANILQTD